MKYLWFFLAGAGFLLNACNDPVSKETWIRPWSENPGYWQYKGKPVLLLGATSNDNLFQNVNLEAHLDSLKAAGGNVIRNTMSDRDPGDERAFMRTPEGKYDLNKWNDAYWQRFEKMLALTSERDIIVQIEIWDRFDHSRDQWLTDPYNPCNNVNYTYEEAGLDSIYPLHPGQNKQPFFFTVPELQNNELLLKYQQAFVKKLLSVSLKYDNVLYCIDNETSGVEEWATYWAAFLKENSGDKDIYITQMWDNWDVKSATHKRTIDHPERYGFIDISQNSQLTGYTNWENAQYVFSYIKDNPRPVNSTKIYGSDSGSWLSRGINTEHAVQTFFRNITGGFASSRFHRPPSGLGLSETSINCLRTVRKAETLVKIWDTDPRMDLLKTNQDNQVYLAAKEDETYLLYFTGPWKCSLDLTGHSGKLTTRWISIETGEWDKTEKIRGGAVVELQSDLEKGALVVIK
ncbi:MAG TPA: hypothetical protein PLV06_07050 [Bacteroidales bacterium]|nr:hypothetical protein [Bacteroidales bacterium]HPF04283.1 hypothetical protein [Bacteroidales bacterium]HPJ60627.1 hypothetical protein [Bacteroidales bacterium]HPR12123.1 hypothetical protein [Bacteroidales bacterium]HRW86476.1 hypothetical protein [Bacteroidales bacterium]